MCPSTVVPGENIKYLYSFFSFKKARTPIQSRTKERNHKAPDPLLYRQCRKVIFLILPFCYSESFDRATDTKEQGFEPHQRRQTFFLMTGTRQVTSYVELVSPYPLRRLVVVSITRCMVS